MLHDTEPDAAPPQSPTPPVPPQSLVLRLAATAGADPRSAKKAIQYGSRAVKGFAGERLGAAMRELGIADPSEAR